MEQGDRCVTQTAKEADRHLRFTAVAAKEYGFVDQMAADCCDPHHRAAVGNKFRQPDPSFERGDLTNARKQKTICVDCRRDERPLPWLSAP
jgi:hypothetical protein